MKALCFSQSIRPLIVRVLFFEGKTVKDKKSIKIVVLLTEKKDKNDAIISKNSSISGGLG